MNPANKIGQTTVLILLFLVCGRAWAQTSDGTLVGSVTDPTGAVVPNATVSALSAQYGQPHETHTDSVGTYRLENLQPGTYSVTFTAPGFSKVSVTGVVVSGSVTTTINNKLNIAGALQTIEVQAPAAQVIDAQSGQLDESVTRQEIAELPYGGVTRDPTTLVLTLPGVHDTPQGQGAVNSYLTEGQAFSVNGTRPRANNFLIDGQDNNDAGITGESYQPTNYGAIQEVTFLTNAYGAEYGRGGGSVTNVIYKSGTNNFHGDLWEVNRNSALAAIPAQDQVSAPLTKNPFDNQNTFGFDAGGPIVKDKLFVFGAAQWDRERLNSTGPAGQFLPTPAGIVTLKSLEPNANISLFLTAIGPLVGAAGTPTTSLVPLGTDSLGIVRPSVEIGPFQLQNVKTVSNGYDWNYRMDWHFTDRDVLTGSIIRENFSLSPDTFANFGALPGFETEQSGHSELVRVQWAHTISSNLINELHLSYSNINFGFFMTPATANGPQANIPWIQFGNDINFPAIGVAKNFPQSRSHNTYQIQEALSYSANRHTIKAGIDVTILNLHDINALNTRGSLTYNFGGTDGTGATYSSLGNFIDDFTGSDPGSASKGFGNPNFSSHANMFAPYIQDTWRIRNDLTLTAGLRYEYWGSLANSLAFPAFNINAGLGLPNATDPSFASDPAKFDSLFSFKQIPDQRNFAPRLGLAYTPHWGKFFFGDGKTVIRAGYGIFYDGLFSNLVDGSATSQPNSFGGSIPFQFGHGAMSASTFPNLGPLNTSFFIQSMASNLHNPLTQQWNVDVQRQLPLGLVMTLAYVGTRGDRLFTNQDFNPALGLDPSSFAYVYSNPNFGEVGVRTNNGQSWYSSGQVEVERKIHTLVLRGSYTYSKFMDDASEIFQLGSNAAVDLASYPQVLTNQYSDWGPSAFDQRHRFSVAYVWQVPYVHENAFLRALTDQWQWSGIASIESGTPNSVMDGLDNGFTGHSNSRPDLGNPNAPFTAVGIDGGNIWTDPFGSFTPGLFYNFDCAYFTAGPCTPKPADAYHFIIPAQTINSAGLYVAAPGNVGRNSVFGPGQIYFDTAVQRDFPVHFWKLEGQTISLRAEFLNAFNHPNLFTPSYTITDSNFDNTAITINGGRQIKLWLKYSF
ncbi:MAG TPA: carboxypeptidase regulatory-like domain-containing protein [Candidatus Saccharimonadales bacterium]|nr:carboxypeptidase regulatory-like domain-containing protein [Candidatus Saccharimonadales bacterium]